MTTLANVPAKGVVALTSGGLDSTVMAYLLVSRGYEVFPLFVDYGQQASAKELAAARKILPKQCGRSVKLVRIPALAANTHSRLTTGREGNFWMPHRNLLLITVAGIYAQSIGMNVVSIGVIGEATIAVPDADSAFLEAATGILTKSAGCSCLVVAPLRSLNKADVMRLASALQVPARRTWSCYLGGQKPCGSCPACLSRSLAETFVTQERT